MRGHGGQHVDDGNHTVHVTSGGCCVQSSRQRSEELIVWPTTGEVLLSRWAWDAPARDISDDRRAASRAHAREECQGRGELACIDSLDWDWGRRAQ
jgi:hypothetical protein